MSRIRLANIAEPATPAAGKTEIYVDTADNKLKTKDDTGKVTSFDFLASEAIAALDIDWSLPSDSYSKSVAVDSAFTFSNDADGQTILLAIENTDVAAHDMTFPVGVKWQNGASTVTINAGEFAVVSFVKIGSNIFANAVTGMQ